MSEPEEETILLAPDPVEFMKEQGKSPEVAGFLAWLIPGAGHFYAGHKLKGGLAFLLILGLFLGGVVRSRGECVSLRPNGHQFAFMAQIGVGAPTFLALAYDSEKLPGLTPGYKQLLESDHEEYSHQVPRSETGLLFTMIAGLLNMLLVWDALSGVPGGTQRRIDEARRKLKVQALREEVAAAARAGEGAAPPETASDAPAPEGAGEGLSEGKQSPDADKEASAQAEVSAEDASSPDVPKASPAETSGA